MSTENLLLSSARSGTNFFLTVYAKCYPDDFVAKEIFRPKFDSLPLLRELLGIDDEEIKDMVLQDPLRLWHRIVATCRAQDRAALVKTFYYHVDHGSDLWAHFKQNTKIVHLIRRNQFDVFVSQKIAQQTGKWQKFQRDEEEEEPLPPLLISEPALEGFLKRQKKNIEWARKTFGDGDYHEVFYEDIAGSPADCAAQIARIYNREPASMAPKIGLTKQKKMPNTQIVENYDELRHYDAPLF